MRVVLHIGGHKTGTTYLQHFWARNAGRLAEHGVCYPSLYENNAHHVLAAPWLRLYGVPDAYFADGGSERGWNDLRASVPTDTKVLLLSAENFSRMAPERVDFGHVIDRLSIFGAVDVLYVWRDPIEMLQSIWLERFKSGDNTKFEAMLAEAMRRELATGVAVVPDRVWEMLRASLPADHIHFLDYGRAKSHRLGLPGALMQKLGLSIDMADFEPIEEARANKSSHPHAAYIAQRFGATPEDRRRIAADWAGLLSAWGKGRPMVYTRDELAEARARFLRNEVRFFDMAAADGIALDPPWREDEEKWQCRDEIAEEIWLDLARRAFHRVA